LKEKKGALHKQQNQTRGEPERSKKGGRQKTFNPKELIDPKWIKKKNGNIQKKKI